jgi:hypothetical protein
MSARRTSLALIWVALFVTLVPSYATFQHGKSQGVSVSFTQDIYSAEAETMIPLDEPEEGEVYQDDFTQYSSTN